MLFKFQTNTNSKCSLQAGKKVPTAPVVDYSNLYNPQAAQAEMQAQVIYRFYSTSTFTLLKCKGSKNVNIYNYPIKRQNFVYEKNL